MAATMALRIAAVLLLAIAFGVDQAQSTCAWPPELKLESALNDCIDKYGRAPCAIKCGVEAFGWCNDKGIPQAKLVKAIAAKVEEPRLNKALEECVVCVKQRGAKVNPAQDSCVSYVSLGICLQRAFSKHCPNLIE